MHEMSVIENLVLLLRDVCAKEKAIRVVLVHMTIHPFSCLDEGNLNFMFSCIVGDDPLLKGAKIKVQRNKNLQEPEYIVDNVELELE
ncbi:MAG TPA: hydrogenase/urease maturation nickel metallochaperone HypA [bacterium]|nr:hydrogenase/urease maturation nickel metallochaperone HypA [bacterium]HOL49683.1 hydrogenase/urease maturation nickel metallochaperone HypA [bacterium]HPO52642.1 hydrogenase/urease maturation nickel metallochaperone HypA [bacterium]HXK44902.1 hydrogenase/urease maturation nickel metallochaperone HypA [bacterium]